MWTEAELLLFSGTAFGKRDRRQFAGVEDVGFIIFTNGGGGSEWRRLAIGVARARRAACTQHQPLDEQRRPVQPLCVPMPFTYCTHRRPRLHQPIVPTRRQAQQAMQVAQPLPLSSCLLLMMYDPTEQRRTACD